MERILILTTLVGTVAAIWAGDFSGGFARPKPVFGGFARSKGVFGGYGRPVISKRDDNENSAAPVTTQDLYAIVKETLQNATQGILGSDLAAAADAIETLAQNLISKGLPAPEEEVRNLIREIAAKLNIDTYLSQLLDDPITAQAADFDAALRLLEGLVDRAQELEAEGKPVNAALGGIVIVAQAIEKGVLKTVGIITLLEARDEDEDDETRSSEPGSVSKRQGSFSAGGFYHGPSNWGVNAQFTYKWGRR